MPTVELDCGLIDYVDTGGDGPVVVFTHGFPMSASQWRKVVPLMAGHRCVLPTLPMGSHRHPMERGTDLSQLGMARIVAQLLDRLDLRDVTLVMNDWGGPQFLVADDSHERIARMVFVACEAFDNFPPRAARPFAAGLRLPGGPWLAAQLFRTPMVRRGRNAYGAMSLSPIPEEILDEWFTPLLRDRRIRADFAAFGTGAPRREVLARWNRALAEFDKPALVVWARQDAMMSAEHGPRLAALLPQGRLAWIEDSATLVPEDQPERLAELLRDFIRET